MQICFYTNQSQIPGRKKPRAIYVQLNYTINNGYSTSYIPARGRSSEWDPDLQGSIDVHD